MSKSETVKMEATTTKVLARHCTLFEDAVDILSVLKGAVGADAAIDAMIALDNYGYKFVQVEGEVEEEEPF